MMLPVIFLIMEDFPEPRERSRPKKSEPRPLSQAALEKFIEYLIGCFYVIPKTAAYETKLPIRLVGICINVCLKNGLLFPIEKYPTHDEEGKPNRVHIGPKYVAWKDNQWQHAWRDLPTIKSRWIEDCFRKMKPGEWDGLAYKVNEEKAREAKNERANSKFWECARCGKLNEKGYYWARSICSKCGQDPTKSFEKPLRVCEVCKCGIEMRVISGRRREHHPLSECNMNQVNEILSG